MAQRYGEWEIDSSLGEGGQSHTFLVRRAEEHDGTLHVLKRLKNRKRLARFEREIQAGLDLEAENVVAVVDYDLTGEKPYLVMEHCEGGELSDEKIARFDLVGKLEIFLGICRGVAHAHERGVIHRDIKFANIFLRGNDVPVVGDFGLCHIDDGQQITLVDEVVGTFYYIAPELEQRRFEDVGPHSDVYSLGKLLYRFISGQDLPREMHRDSPHDLRLDSGYGAEIHHVYELFDAALQTDSTTRPGNARELVELAESVLRRIKLKAHVLDAEVRIECEFCRIGTYNVLNGDGNLRAHAIKNFGFNPVGSAHWLFMTCAHCGHVKLFRLEGNRAKNWHNLR